MVAITMAPVRASGGSRQPNCRWPSRRISTIGSFRVNSQETNAISRTPPPGEGHDQARAEPVVALALVEHEFERAEPDRNEDEADIVDANPFLKSFASPLRRRMAR